MGADLTVRQKILVAASVLGEEADAFSVEDLIVRSWQLYPEAFSLRGYFSKHPDSNRVLAKLSGVDGLCGLGWLEHTDQRMYRVMRKGRVIAKQLQGLATGGALVSAEVDEAAEAPAVNAPKVAARKEEAAAPAAAAPKAARARKAEPKKSAPPPPVVELTVQDVYAVGVIAKSDALRKFLRGSPLTFADACSFWGFSTSSRPAVVQQRVDAATDLLKKAVESFGNGASADPRLPPLSTCYGLFNLHRLMSEKFARELDVLRLLGEGAGNRAIGERLGISDHTVKFHLGAIFGKLGVTTRTAAVRRALRLGWIDT